MRLRWDVDEATIVELDTWAFGKADVTVNGARIAGPPFSFGRGAITFDLPNNQHAVISKRRAWFEQPVVELRVDGRLMIATPKVPIACTACGAVAKPYDRYCAACGRPMPTAEDHLNRRRVRHATQAMWTLAALFGIAGTALCLVTRSQNAELAGTTRCAGSGDRTAGTGEWDNLHRRCPPRSYPMGIMERSAGQPGVGSHHGRPGSMGKALAATCHSGGHRNLQCRRRSWSFL